MNSMPWAYSYFPHSLDCCLGQLNQMRRTRLWQCSNNLCPPLTTLVNQSWKALNVQYSSRFWDNFALRQLLIGFLKHSLQWRCKFESLSRWLVVSFFSAKLSAYRLKHNEFFELYHWMRSFLKEQTTSCFHFKFAQCPDKKSNGFIQSGRRKSLDQLC